MKVAGLVINDWQLSGVFTARSGRRTTWASATRRNGAHVNLTGSPDYGARIVYIGDPGNGCSTTSTRSSTPRP